MPTIAIALAASSDDAAQVSSTMFLANTVISLGGNVTEDYVGFRFTGLPTDLANVVVVSASLELTGHGSSSGTFNGVLNYEDNAAPATFTTAANNISGRTLSAANASANAADIGSGSPWSNGVAYEIDITMLMQNWVNNHGGNTEIALIYTATVDGAAGAFSFRTLDNVNAGVPTLNVVYEMATEATQDLGLTQSVSSAGSTVSALPTHTLQLTDVASPVVDADATHDLGLTQVVDALLLTEPLVHTLTLTQIVASVLVTNPTVSQNLSLTQNDELANALDAAVLQQMGLSGAVSLVYDITVLDTLALSQASAPQLLEAISQALGLSQAVTSAVATLVVQTLALQQVVSSTHDGQVSVLQNLALSDSAVALSDLPCHRETHVPVPTLGSASDVVLSHPVTSPTSSVTLPVPELGNILALDSEASIRRTASGELSVANPSTHNTHKISRYNFVGLTEAQQSALVSFLETTAAFEIRLRDHENRDWRGVVVSKDIIRVQDERGSCSFSVGIDFEGDYV